MALQLERYAFTSLVSRSMPSRFHGQAAFMPGKQILKPTGFHRGHKGSGTARLLRWGVDQCQTAFMLTGTRQGHRSQTAFMPGKQILKPTGFHRGLAAGTVRLHFVGESISAKPLSC